MQNYRKPEPLKNAQGFVLITVLMLLILFTGVSMATLYSVTASIKGTGYMRERVQRFYQADGGWQAVYGYMCERSITNSRVQVGDFSAEFADTGLPYEVVVGDNRVVKRRVPGYSGELLGRDVELLGLVNEGGSIVAQTEVLVFIGQTHLTGGYGNE